MMIPDLRYRAERLDEIPESAKLDQQNVAFSENRPFERGPQPGQSFEVNMKGQILEGLEKLGMDGQIGRADGG
jgi:hypothetical protein